MKFYGVKFAGTGSYVPERVLTNHDLEQMVDTSDEWIRTRTGIRERRIAAPDEPTSALAYRAAEAALAAAGKTATDLDLLIVATLTPDHPFPNTACYVQEKLGASNTACFSLEAACSGFLYGLQTATALIQTGLYRTALVIGAEKLSSLVDWTDRNTCVLFGDGAGAVVLERTEPESNAVLASSLGADGTFHELLYVPAGGSAMPASHETLDQRLNFIKMNGREVFKLAVGSMVSAANEVLEQTGITIDQIRWLVPHQANDRIIQAVGKRLDIPEERVFAATIPIALDEIVRGGHLQKGEYALLVAFGGGLTWGAALIRW